MVNLTNSKNRILPTAEELPSSDQTPVDNQLQIVEKLRAMGVNPNEI